MEHKLAAVALFVALVCYVRAQNNLTNQSPTAAVNRPPCILLIGGYLGPGATHIELYNTTDKACSPDVKLSSTYIRNGAPALVRASMSMAVDGSRCMSCGGLNPTELRLTDCFMFDANSEQDGWVAMEPMPLGLAAYTIVMLGSDVFVLGGESGLTGNIYLYRYNVDEHRWHTEEQPLPDYAHQTPGLTSRGFAMAAPVSEHRFIYCGGWSCRADCQLYDAALKQWSKAAPLTHGRFVHQMVNVDGTVYALGGITQVDSLRRSVNTVEAYNATADAWSTAEPLSGNRHSFFATAIQRPEPKKEDESQPPIENGWCNRTFPVTKITQKISIYSGRSDLKESGGLRSCLTRYTTTEGKRLRFDVRVRLTVEECPSPNGQCQNSRFTLCNGVTDVREHADWCCFKHDVKEPFDRIYIDAPTATTLYDTTAPFMVSLFVKAVD